MCRDESQVRFYRDQLFHENVRNETSIIEQQKNNNIFCLLLWLRSRRRAIFTSLILSFVCVALGYVGCYAEFYLEVERTTITQGTIKQPVRVTDAVELGRKHF